jgi:hypothetical protein
MRDLIPHQPHDELTTSSERHHVGRPNYTIHPQILIDFGVHPSQQKISCREVLQALWMLVKGAAFFLSFIPVMMVIHGDLNPVIGFGGWLVAMTLVLELP